MRGCGRHALVIALILGACSNQKGAEPAARRASAPSARYLKGQTHVHTDNSGDSRTPAAEVARWYADHGFDFIVFTDHNVVTTHRGEGLLTIPGVEITQNLGDCRPPPPAGGACLFHVNALFVGADADGPIQVAPVTGEERAVTYQRAIDLAASLGGIAQLNHPNMGWAVSGDLAVELAGRGITLVEIANMSEAESNAGDAEHPSAEALWDRMLSSGATVYGIASDDAHHYGDAQEARRRGEPTFVGNLAYIMVRSERDVASIRAAIARGEFYSTTGIELARAEEDSGRLTIEVIDDGAGPFEITFIGVHGRTLQSSRGVDAQFDLPTAPAGYVRVRVTDSRQRAAWTQPIRTPQ